jgi:hypothetical protein
MRMILSCEDSAPKLNYTLVVLRKHHPYVEILETRGRHTRHRHSSVIWVGASFDVTLT